MSSLKKIRDQAWEFYDKWRKNPSYSPALGCVIKVSLKGWHHISGLGDGPSRTFDDIHRRMKLLPHAKDIIEKSTTIQNVITKRGRKYYTLEAMVEVNINSTKTQKKVRVIIIEDKNQGKIFLSVMAKKQKT